MAFCGLEWSDLTIFLRQKGDFLSDCFYRFKKLEALGKSNERLSLCTQREQLGLSSACFMCESSMQEVGNFGTREEIITLTRLDPCQSVAVPWLE